MKIFVCKRKAAGAMAFIFALCMVCYVVTYSSFAGAYTANRQLPIYCVDTEQKTCSISFDAAWGDRIMR